MSFYTNPIVVAARTIARKMGVNSIFSPYRSGSSYEKAFSEGLSEEVRIGDCFWDVGANVGYYSKKMSAAVGESGKVFAFEPSRINVTRLNDATKKCGNIVVVNVALGNEIGRVSFVESEDSLGGWSQISIDKAPTDCMVDISTADHLVSTAQILVPNVIKIDVEGYEGEVIRGMAKILSGPEVRALFIELHFDLLEKRGFKHAVKEIERDLKSNGFKIKWFGPSQLRAKKPN